MLSATFRERVRGFQGPQGIHRLVAGHEVREVYGLDKLRDACRVSGSEKS